MRYMFYLDFIVYQGVHYRESSGKEATGKRFEKDQLCLIWVMNRR